MLDFLDWPESYVSHVNLLAPANEIKIEPIKAGWGACRSCSCKGYTQNQEDKENYMCGTCGHHWKQHY